MPSLVTQLNWAPIVQWFKIRCAFKNVHPKDICLKEIGLLAQNMFTVLDSKINIIGGTYMII